MSICTKCPDDFKILEISIRPFIGSGTEQNTQVDVT